MSYRDPPHEPGMEAANLTWGETASLLNQLACGLLVGLLLVNAVARAAGLPGLAEIVDFLYATDSDNLVPVLTFSYFLLLGFFGSAILKFGRWIRRTLRSRREPQA